MCQKVYLQEEYSRDKQLKLPNLDCTIPGMEMARPVTNVISSTEEKNLAGSLVPLQQGDGRQIQCSIMVWSKG